MSPISPLPQTVIELQAMARFYQGEIERLNLIIAKYRRARFGCRSEQMANADQLALQLEEQAIEAAVTPAVTAPSTASRQPSRRRPLPAHLPRETQTHLPEHQQCPDCGNALRRIGEDVAEVLEYIPARFNLKTSVGRVGVCGFCELSPIGEMPAYPAWGAVHTRRPVGLGTRGATTSNGHSIARRSNAAMRPTNRAVRPVAFSPNG